MHYVRCASVLSSLGNNLSCRFKACGTDFSLCSFALNHLTDSTQTEGVPQARARSPGLSDRRLVCYGPSFSIALKPVTCGPCDWDESVHQRILHSRVLPLPLTLAPQDTAPAFPACSCVTPCGISSSTLLQ